MSLEKIDKEKFYVFYDGDCGFCNFWVQWILKNDQKDQFLFAALQSPFGQRFLKERGLPNLTFDTIYLWKPQQYYHTKSKAILQIAEILGGKYSVLSRFATFFKIFPDFMYDIIAKNRKKLAPESCLVPTAEERKKFIQD